MPGRLPSSQELLNDTLILVRLARETAIAHGKYKQVERFSPIIENLKKVVETSTLSSTILLRLYAGQ